MKTAPPAGGKREWPIGLAAMCLGATLLVLSGCVAEAPPDQIDASQQLPASPISDRMVRCLDDAGWQITRSLQGGFDGPANLSAQQNEVFMQAFDTCADQYGWSIPPSEYTESQKSELYQQEIAASSCLADHGYPGEQPPSEQTYLDTFATADQYYAVMVIADLPRDTQEPLIRACPPPTWFLNIDGFD